MSLPAYAEYKDSGVEWLGDVPKHWPKMALKWKARIRSGDGISPYQINVEPSDDRRVPVFGGNGIMGYTSIDNINKPSIVIGRVGALCGNIHKVDVGVWVSDNALCLDFHDGFYNVNYLSILLEVRNLNDIADKSAQPLITGSKVLNQIIPCPPLPEQTIIARFLDHETAKIDALIADQQRLIELLKEKRQAVISHAVTKGLDPNAPMKDSGVEWLGDVPEHWEVKKLGFALDVHNNLRTPIDRAIRAEKAGDYPYYGPTGILDYVDEFFVEGEYFLLGEDGDHFLKFEHKPMTIIVSGKFCVNNHAHVLKGKDGCLTEWGAVFFETRDVSPWLIKQGMSRYKLRKDTLVNIPIVVPPALEQRKIVRFLDSMKLEINNVIAECEESIHLLKERRSALISAAVTGKIDVRGWQPPATAATTPQGQQQILFDD